MVEKNTEAAVNMKIANPPKQEPIMAPNAPTELSQQSIQQIVAGLQQAQGSTGLPSRDLPTNNAHITQDEQINLIMFQNQKIQIILKMTKNLNFNTTK